MPSRRQRQGGFGLIMLVSQILNIGVDRIPPVTLFTVIANVVIYMRLIPGLPSVHAACTSNHYVWNKKQWSRLATSSFYHLDDMHLYFNMVSFIWKGMTLERKMKSKMFFIVIALFSVLTQVVMLIVNQIFAEVMSNNAYVRTCAAGFSAVIFSLKVLTTVDSDGMSNPMGLPINVPTRYACWAELILIHILVPNSSFTGHLSGILVGLLYTHGPLRLLIKGLKYMTSGNIIPVRTSPHSYTRQAEPTGYHNVDDDEAVQRAIQESLRHSHFQGSTHSSSGGGGGSYGYPPQNQSAPSYGWNISDEPVTQPDNERLYPSLPTDNHHGFSNTSPSAPPADDNNGPSGPPYPTSSGPPYPTSSGPPYPTSSGPPYPTSSGRPYSPPNEPPYPPSSGIPYPPADVPMRGDLLESDENVMRTARLRKFEKSIR